MEAEKVNVKREERKGLVQRILEIPIIGTALTLIIGLLPPYFLATYLYPYNSGDAVQKLMTNLTMSFLMAIWNLFLFYIFRVKATTLLLFVIGLLGTIFQIIRYFTL